MNVKVMGLNSIFWYKKRSVKKNVIKVKLTKK